MSLHRMVSVRLAVPNVQEVATYYEDFGLLRNENRFSTTDGGEQLILEYGPRRHAIEVTIGVDDTEDLDRIVRQLHNLNVQGTQTDESVSAYDKFTEVVFTATIAPHIVPTVVLPPEYNSAGRAPRLNVRAPALTRNNRVRPRKLGHVVLGSKDFEFSRRLLGDGFGLKLSDLVVGVGAFMRCSTDHHNIFVQKSPIPFLHHSSWQVDDVDEVGRGATTMIESDPSRHTWGLGRHYIGSNFFWYLRDPAGNFSEYYSDMDAIVDEQLWEPGIWDSTNKHAGWAWGLEIPNSFIHPEDIAAYMVGAHSTE